jgi:integrase/recombinase XerC
MSLPAVITPGTLPAIAEITDADVTAAWLEQLSPHTRRAYGGDLRHFAEHVSFFGGESVGTAVTVLLSSGPGVANRAAISWRAAMAAAGLSAATIARRLSALRSVVDLAASLGRITWTITVRSPKVETYRDVRGPGLDGWRRMVDHLRSQSGNIAVRDMALLRLLHDLGSRRGAAVGLDIKDIEMSDGRPAALWMLLKGKTSPRRKELAPETADALSAWIRIRGSEPGPLFIPLDRPLRAPYSRLTGRGVGIIVGRIGRRAGLERAVHSHGIRHEAITRLVEMGVSIFDVQQFADHADPRTTAKYLDRIMNPQPRLSKLLAAD